MSSKWDMCQIAAGHLKYFITFFKEIIGGKIWGREGKTSWMKTLKNLKSAEIILFNFLNHSTKCNKVVLLKPIIADWNKTVLLAQIKAENLYNVEQTLNNAELV